MTDNTQPEALDLADWLEAVGGGPSAKRCAALLREQHARIAELEAQLEAIGAGGVEPLRSRRCLHQIAEPGVAPEHALKDVRCECCGYMTPGTLGRFAALAAAAEREECAKVCEYRAMALDHSGNQYVRDHAALDCARSIRARGKT